MFRKNEEARPIISLGRRSDPYALYSDSEDDFEEIEFDKAVFERRYKYEYEPRKKLSRRRLLLCLMFTSFIGILGTFLYYYFSRQVIQLEQRTENSELNVRISGGFVRGGLEDDVFVFKGIPYAKPPQRWRPPSKCGWNDCWNGTFEALEFGERCVQAKFGKSSEEIGAIGSEDCLFINIWTPTTSSSKKKLPVMVYLHGGGFLSSSGHEHGLHPTPEMIKDMEIVGVSLNYRLDAFGFLTLDILNHRSNQNTSGNYGFMDQIVALEWIRENIARFGGDPGKVTILGQGSGGTSVVALLASPKAKGLFQKAIALSPSADITKTSSEAAKHNEILLNNTNCIGNASMKLQCLNALTPLQILKASPWNAYHYKQKDDSRDFPTKGIFPLSLAVVDGYVLPSAPVVAIKSNNFNDVPLILGNTAQEIDDRPKKNFQNSSIEQFKVYAKRKLLPFLGNSLLKFEDIFSSYKKEISTVSAQYFYATIVSDIREVCPVEYLAITAAKHFASPVYRYIATSTPSHDIHLPQGSPQYSFHEWDLIAFYSFHKYYKYSPSEDNLKFKEKLRTEFKYFFYNGKVRSQSWIKHPKTTAIFSNKELQVMSKIYHKKECLFWLKNGFAPYAWVN